MRDLLVAVLHVHAAGVRAWLADVDRPGTSLRGAARPRTDDLVTDAVRVLEELDATGLSTRLLSLAVAVDTHDSEPLRRVLGAEVPEGWPLPATLPVVVGRAVAWVTDGAGVPDAPLLAGAAVAGARAVGAHAHLPRLPDEPAV